MTDPDPGRPAGGADPDPSSGSRWSWKSVGFALAVVVGVAFLLQMGSLVFAFFEVPSGFDRAALVTILLMIFATGLTVGVIGVGLFRAIGSSPEPRDPAPTGEGRSDGDAPTERRPSPGSP